MQKCHFDAYQQLLKGQINLKLVDSSGQIECTLIGDMSSDYSIKGFKVEKSCLLASYWEYAPVYNDK